MAHPLLKWFRYEHLPAALQAVSRPFADLAHQVARELPENDESREALRKLLEAKDCAVRAQLEATTPSSSRAG